MRGPPRPSSSPSTSRRWVEILGPYDSAELALAACEPGLSHPIGQPLHTLLGFVACHLPAIPSLVGLGLLSALPAALTILPVASIAERLGAGRDPRGTGIVLALFALHATLWEPATRVEVYALGTFFALWSIARGVAAERPRDHALVGLAAGLAASSNAWLGVMAAATIAPRLLFALRRDRRAPRQLGAAVALGLAGLVPYAWIPYAFVARRGHAFVWGASGAPDALSFYLRGADYTQNRQLTGDLFADNLARFASWGVTSGYLPLLALGALGVALAKDAPRAARFAIVVPVALSIGLVTTNAIYEPTVLDHLGYLAPGLWLAAACVAAALAGARTRSGRGRMGAALGVFVLGVATLVGPPSILARTRARDDSLRVLVDGVLSEAPRDAILVVERDHWAAPLLYVQRVEHARPDLVILPYGLSASSWYWQLLQHDHPRLRRFALRGPGGRPARLQRFLGANPERAVLVQTRELGAIVGLPICGVGFLARARPCPAPALDPGVATRATASLLSRIGHGSPATDEVLASVALDRGLALADLGRFADALSALLSGVVEPPASRWPAGSSLDAPLGPLPPFTGHAAIGDERRNLHVAAILLLRAGAERESRRLLDEAARRGLPRAFATPP